MSLPDELTVWVSYLLRQAALRAQAEVGKALSEHALRPPHHSVMAMIERGSQSQVALSAMLQTDRTTMVAIVDDLERMKLAKRRVSPLDRRAHDVTLTKAGRKALIRSRAAIDQADARLLANFSPAERALLQSFLERLIASYDRRLKLKEIKNAE